MGRRIPADWMLFILAVGLYLITRFTQLDRFPIYFFCDEASIVVFGSNLLKTALKGSDGVFLPLYFEAADGRWQPILPVYFYTVATPLLGSSILVARGVSVVIGTLAPVAVSLLLKFVFRSRFWWMGALLLAASPAWFLHSRTAFQTVTATAFFACFLLAYALYRDNRPKFLYLAIVTWALTFYTYSAAQVSIAALAAALVIVDLPYHWSCLRDRRLAVRAALLILAAALPLVAFLARHPSGYGQHLRTVHSYWNSDASTPSKLARFAGTYARGINPGYWFVAHEQDLVRHRMKGFAHLPTLAIPFFLVGAAISIRMIRTPAYRLVLMAAVAAPVGAAVYDVLITRVLLFVVPASLLIAIGIDAVMERLPRPGLHWKTAVLFVVLAAGALVPFRAALRYGALWFRDYGLYGMQFGARELFTEAIPRYLREHPAALISISPVWANGPEWFPHFFDTPPQVHRFERYTIDYFDQEMRAMPDNLVLIATAAEFEKAKGNRKFEPLRAELTVPYPDGTPGFHFVPLKYSAEAPSLFGGKTDVSSSNPEQETSIPISGGTMKVACSRPGKGRVEDLFDGKPDTILRGLNANPLVIDLRFDKPRRCSGVRVVLGPMKDVTVTALMYSNRGRDPAVLTARVEHLAAPPAVSLGSAPLDQVARVRVEIRDNAAPGAAQVEIHELELR